MSILPLSGLLGCRNEGRGQNKRPVKEVFKAPLAPSAKVPPISSISEEGTAEVETSVRISGYFDGRKEIILEQDWLEN